MEERRSFIIKKYTDRSFINQKTEPMSIIDLYNYIRSDKCSGVDLYVKLFTIYDKKKNSFDDLIEKNGYKGTLLHLCVKDENIPLIEWMIWNNLCLEYYNYIYQC